MTGTASTSLATRPNGIVRGAQQGTTALALRGDQTTFDDKQRAALVAMGVSRDVTPADLAVFFHQCRRTGLDPFIRQIYLIHRRERVNGDWIAKPTTQTGIDGYRLIRDRIAKREGIKVEYEPTVWWDGDGGSHQAWLWDELPAACTVAIRVDDRRYSSTLRFKEYAQYKDRDSGVLNSMWAAKPAHMIEKCAEADVLRRAFPQDLSGLASEDEADPDTIVQPQAQQQRPSAAAIRERRQPVQAVVEPVTDASPAGSQATPVPGESVPPVTEPAGEARKGPKASSGQVGVIREHFTRLGYTDDDRPARLRATARLAGHDGELGSTNDLTADQAARVLRQLNNITDGAALTALLEDGEVRDA